MKYLLELVLIWTMLIIPIYFLQGQFNFEYLPLKVGDVQGRIELNCNDLGLYTYDLVLKATPAGPERALYFRAGLGTSQVHVAKFLNFAKQKTDYACLVQKPKVNMVDTQCQNCNSLCYAPSMSEFG